MLPKESQIIGLASPVSLEFDKTTITTADYFISPSLIDSVVVPASLSASLSSDREEVVLSGSLDAPLGVMTFWLDEFGYDILLKKSNKQEVTITFDPQGKQYESVQLKGEMNNWNPAAAPFTEKDGIWITTMLVNEGVYQYILMLDGKETPDPANPNTVSNGMGGTNSVLTVGDVEAEKPMLETYDHSEPVVYLKTPATENTIVLWENYQLETRFKDNILSFEIPANCSKRGAFTHPGMDL